MTWKVYEIQGGGKSYIGITHNSLEYRFSQHIQEAKKKRKYSALHEAITEIGVSAFSISLIEEFPNNLEGAKQAVYAEIKHIKEKGTAVRRGYNIVTKEESYYDLYARSLHCEECGKIVERELGREYAAQIDREKAGGGCGETDEEGIPIIDLSILCQECLDNRESSEDHWEYTQNGTPYTSFDEG